MKKMLSRITAAVLAAGMLATEAGAVLTVPNSTDAGTIAGSGMWLVQLYNEGNPDDDKPATDYGIDYSAVAGARFTFELDLDNPELGGNADSAFSLFEGNIGGGIALSCNGGDIIQYEDDGETYTEMHETYNWQAQYWWGCEFVNGLGETIDTNPNTMDDDLTNDNDLSTVRTGDYTYTITADFVNPLSCETDEWEINEIGVMQLAFQEWGNDIVPIEITCCEILDADGEVLVWFDGQGNPSLENIAENNGGGSSGPDDNDDDDDNTDDVRDVITASGTATITLNEVGGVDGTILQVYTPNVGGTIELQPGDRVDVTVAPVDSDIDTSEWVVAYNCFTSEWGGWNGVMSEAGVLELSASVQEMMDVIDVTDIADFGGFLFQVWNTDADVEIDWAITITPDGVSTEPGVPDEPADDYNGYIFLQTGAYSYRNKWYDEYYGKDSVYFYNVLVNGENAETYSNYAEYYNSDISAYVMPASFTDAIISGDGSYQVGIADFDWAMDGADSFNTFGILTDIPYSDDITISDITILVDGMIVETDAEACISDDEGYICITLVNIWDDEPEGFEGMYPTESIGIDFSINGLDVPSDEEPIEPIEPVEPENDGWLKFYMQNRGGDWAWFDVEEYIIHLDGVDETTIFELSWLDIQSAITDESGESLLCAPVEEWESYPALGIEIGSHLIREDGDMGRVSAKIEDITITLTDGTSFMIPDRLLNGDLLGVDEGWGIGGYNAYIDFADIIMATLDIDGEEYFEILKTIDSVSANVVLEEFIPYSENLSDSSVTADAVEITDIKVGKDYVTFSWTQSANAENYSIYLINGNELICVDTTTDTTYTYEAESCTEYTFVVQGNYDECAGGAARFTVITHHDYEEEYTVDRKATCNQTGVKSIHCKNCDARINITETETTDHEYSSVVVAPTHSKGGYTLHMCLYCNDSYKTDITDKLSLPVITDVSVTSKTETTITLSWTESDTADGYIIEQYTNSGWIQIADIADKAIATYEVTDLTPGTAYKFRMKAYVFTKQGEVIYGNKTSTLSVNTMMTAVNDFAGTSDSTSEIRLSWTENTYATGYIIEQFNGSAWEQIANITDGATTSYTVSDLGSGTAYKFRMKAYSVTKYGETIYGNKTATITVNTQSFGVTDLALKSRSSSALRLNWTKNTEVDGYVIEQYIDGAWTQIAEITDNTVTEYKVADLDAFTCYEFRMKAYTVTKYGEKTYTDTLTEYTLPSAVTGLTVKSKSTTAIRLGWKQNDSAKGYIIEQYIDGVWTRVGKVTSNETVTYRIDGLSSGTTYKFRVRSYNVTGSSSLYGSYVYVNGTTL